MTGLRSPEVDAATVAAFCHGDHDAFARISRDHFRELHIHCYRMVGSFDEAEDLVQETFLRAWRKRTTYERRSTIRAWLYGIATNACIDFIRKRAPRRAPMEKTDLPLYSQVPWIQPYPDALLDTTAGEHEQPDTLVVARESIELAFLAAVQLLPAKQRAVLILHDVLSFSAAETAQVLDDTPAAVNSALQRARATLRRRRAPNSASPPTPEATFGERLLLQILMDAQERGDIQAIVDLLREDVRMTLFPDGVMWDGRDEVAYEFLKGKDAFFFKRNNAFGDVRCVGLSANRQPALAVYLRRTDDTEYRACAIVVLGVRDGKLREIATFASPDLFARFNLPATLSDC